MKRVLWVIPVLALGMAIGGVTVSSVLAAGTVQGAPPIAQGPAMMQQALGTPQGQAMIQACSNFMSQFSQAQK